MGVFGKAVRDFYYRQSRGPFYACTADADVEVDPGFYLNECPSKLEIELLQHAKGRCLDIGCGAGRTMRYLTKKGLAVVGIDIDEDLIELCNATGLTEVYHKSWEHIGDLGIFETIIMLNHSVGMTGTVKGTRDLFRKCYLCSSSEAILVFDSRKTPSEETPDSCGIVVKELRDKYGSEYSEPFKWISFDISVAHNLACDAGWLCTETLCDDRNYGIVCQKAS